MRPYHGATMSLEEIANARDTLLRASAVLPFAFAARTAIDFRDYDFMFRDLQKPDHRLPEEVATRNALIDLGLTMAQSDAGGEAQTGNSNIPSGYTYFGQFVDHDISLEASSGKLPALMDPDMVPLDGKFICKSVRNVRQGTLDLDSVYSNFDPGENGTMRIGPVSVLKEGRFNARPAGRDIWNDVPRNPRNTKDNEQDRAAMIGDPRNDDNVILSQLHVAFLRAHNRLMREGNSFAQAETILRKHYQHIVIHDYLKQIADPKIVDEVLDGTSSFYKVTDERFFVPFEFTVAAFRFGHSMIRNEYEYNLNQNSREQPAVLDHLFSFTALRGDLGPAGGFDTLPENWIIEWERFVKREGVAEHEQFNYARRIDTHLVQPLFRLRPSPDESEHRTTLPRAASNLAVRNLLRGYRLRLPTGQAVAGAMNIDALSHDEFRQASGSTGQFDVLEQTGLLDRTPLWYYILAEAGVRGGGNHLGPVGSRIVSEVLVELVRRSKDSIFDDKSWSPSLGSNGKFTLEHLIRYSGGFGDEAPH